MPTELLPISKIAVPTANSGGVPQVVYQIKDEVARTLLTGGRKFVYAWKGNETPDTSKIPDTVTVLYNGNAYTGTLTPAAAAAETPMGFWLVNNGDGGNNGFAEYAPVEDTDTDTWRWEKLGDLALSLNDFGALAYMDDVELDKGDGENVIGENATLQAQDSTVTFPDVTQKNALGENATFTLTNPDVNSTKGTIRSERITGVNGTTTANVQHLTTKNLKKKQIIPAKAKRIGGSDVVTGRTYKKLQTSNIATPNTPDNIPILNDYTTKKLKTEAFPVTKKQEGNTDAPPTPYGLTIQMYDSTVHGTIAAADGETLVVSFSTTPTLQLADNAPRMATGALVADSEEGTAAHDAYAAETGSAIVDSVNKTNQPMVTGTSQAPVVAGLKDAEESDDARITFLGDITLARDESITLAEPGKEVDLATGDLVDPSAVMASDESLGGSVVIGGGSVTVPAAGTEKEVLLNKWGTPGDSNITVLTDVSLSGGSVAVNDSDTVAAITALGTGTAAAQMVTFAEKDLKKVALYDDLGIRAEAHPATRYLNFLAPAGGSTITLLKIGDVPAVSLEKSLDGVNWEPWEADAETGNRSHALAEGERLYVRSSSATTARFSTKYVDSNNASNKHYKFSVANGTEVNGIVESLLCRTPELGEIGNTPNTGYQFAGLFEGCRITGRPVINSKVLKNYCFMNMFKNTAMLKAIEIRTPSKGNVTTPLSGWLTGCATTGTIYAPVTLNLSEGASGLPNGWIRVPELPQSGEQSSGNESE